MPDVIRPEFIWPTWTELSWKAPRDPGWNIPWYHVEMLQAKYDSLTQKTSLNVTGLEMYSIYNVSLYSCIMRDVSNYSRPRKFQKYTDAGGKVLYKKLRVDKIYTKKIM